MGVFTHLLFLLLIAGFSSRTSANPNRTSWIHVCGPSGDRGKPECDVRRDALESVRKLSEAASTRIPGKEVDPQFDNCEQYVAYRQHRTNAKFKAQLDKSLEHLDRNFVHSVERLNESLDDMNAHVTLKTVEEWQTCTGAECDTKFRKHFRTLIIGEYTTGMENWSVYLRNAKHRLKNLERRNYIRGTAARRFKVFLGAVKEAYSKVIDGDFDGTMGTDFVLAGWENKCREGFGTDNWLVKGILATTYVSSIYNETLLLEKSLEKLKKLDIRMEKYLTQLENFRICEQNIGHFNTECAKLRVIADEMIPVKLDRNDMQVLTDKDELDRQNIANQKRFRTKFLPGNILPTIQRLSSGALTMIPSFLDKFKTAISNVNDEFWKDTTTALDALNSENSCKEILESFSISTYKEQAKADVNNIYNKIQETAKKFVEFRSRLDKISTDLSRYDNCKETTKGDCGTSLVQKAMEEILAVTNSRRTIEWTGCNYLPPMVRHEFREIMRNHSSRLWDGVKSAGALWRDAPLLQYGWIFPVPYIPIPSWTVYQLTQNDRCYNILKNSKTEKNALPHFHNLLKGAHDNFSKANELLEKEHEMEKELLRIEICNDADELLRECQHLVGELKKKVSEST